MKEKKEYHPSICECCHRPLLGSQASPPFCSCTIRTKEVIDAEPTWATIFSGVKEGILPVDELEKAVKVADIVRQAQKRGKTLTIHPDGKLEEED